MAPVRRWPTPRVEARYSGSASTILTSSAIGSSMTLDM
jgi:hypothetical protein